MFAFVLAPPPMLPVIAVEGPAGTLDIFVLPFLGYDRIDPAPLEDTRNFSWRRHWIGGERGGKGGGNEGVPKMVLARLHIFL